MKKIFVLCAIALAVVTILVWRAVAKPSRFGEFTSAPRAEIASLIADPKAFLGKTLELQGKVSQQCKTMGCYFFFRSGTNELRIDIQEVAMTAPMEEGRTARVQGQMVPYLDGYQFYASAVEFK